MNKFLKKSFYFIPFVVIIYIILIVVWGLIIPRALNSNMKYNRMGKGHLYTRIRDIDNYRNVDILFLGSSHSYRGFDIRIFESNGYTCFNLGSSAQTPIQTKVLLERFLSDLNPKTIIYEVYPGPFCSDGVESALDLISNIEPERDLVKMSFELNHIKVYNTLLFSFFYDLIFRENEMEPIQKKADRYISGGYVETSKNDNFLNIEQSEKNTKRWVFDESQLDAFSYIVKKLTENNVKLLFVLAPTTSFRYETYANNYEVDSVFSSYGVPYFKYAQMDELIDTVHFYDEHHLNQAGVEIFNNKLIDEVLGN